MADPAAKPLTAAAPCSSALALVTARPLVAMDVTGRDRRDRGHRGTESKGCELAGASNPLPGAKRLSASTLKKRKPRTVSGPGGFIDDKKKERECR